MASGSGSVPMGTYENGAFPGNLPILNGKNYDNWFTDSSTVAQKATFKELKKKDYKALFIIHQCVSPDNFERVGDASSAKEAWDNLEKAYGGATKVKK
ncbi:hypothetical protein A2U01_0045899, partial [Trifolium medium]|nr:hypothetical protein [Trifolium medium]